MLKLAVPVIVLLLVVGATMLADAPEPRADLVLINRSEVSTLDPQRMSWNHDLRTARTIFEGLVRHDVFSADYDLLPGVAERWNVAADGIRYTFHLRENARWSNGQPVVAGDFVFAWRRAMLPDTGCDYAQQFLPIRGARAFFEWRSEKLREFRRGIDDAGALWAETERRFAETVALKATDDHTLEFELERPVSYFLDLCAFGVFQPVYPALVKRFERLDPATGRLSVDAGWTKAGTIVSNGPFVLERWRFKRDMRLKTNPHYWNKDAIWARSILLPTIEDAGAQVLAFRSGLADWVSDVIPDYRADMLEEKRAFYREQREAYEALVAQGLDPIEIDRRLPRDRRTTVHAFPAFGTYFYNFNCLPRLADGRDNPFRDPRIRRAFSMTIDRERIAAQVRRCGERPANTLIPRDSIPGYESPAGLPYDPAAARALLAEAGYPDGRGFITVEILFNSEGGHDKIAQAIKKDWEENLGVAVTLRQRELKVFRNDLKNGNYMISRGSWFGDYGDPTTFLNLSRRDDGNNDRKYDSPEFESLMDRTDAETDPAARMALLAQAEAMLVERDLPIAPIYQYVNVYLFDPHEITGISSHPRQVQNAYWIRRIGVDPPGAN